MSPVTDGDGWVSSAPQPITCEVRIRILFVAPVFAAALAQQVFCAPLRCPATLPDWKTWRDQAINDLLRQSTRQHEKFLNTDKLIAASVKIAAFIDTCAPSFSPSAELQAEIGNLAAFTHVFRNTRHEFGYTIDDFDYLSTVQENVSLPELLTSQEFLKKISHRRTYQAALKMITDQECIIAIRPAVDRFDLQIAVLDNSLAPVFAQGTTSSTCDR